jgi:23S rRNA (pseudouridine1915-N3)-methyltransferase
MKFLLFNIGKSNSEYLNTGINDYLRRLKHFIDFSITDLPGVRQGKNFTAEVYKQKEAEIIKKAVSKCDIIVILDENGTEYDSLGFAELINKMMNQGSKQVAFVTGGAFGFSEEIYKIAHYKISLSRMTFTHQLVRLVFIEQLYRAFTIIKGLPYHNE